MSLKQKTTTTKNSVRLLGHVRQLGRIWYVSLFFNSDVDVVGIRFGELIDKRRPKEMVEIKNMQVCFSIANKS